MSGTTAMRGFALFVALALGACASTPRPEELTSQSLLESMAASPRATAASCAALNLALYCHSTSIRRGIGTPAGDRCSCVDRQSLVSTMSGQR